jgi:hypothetical protein
MLLREGEAKVACCNFYVFLQGMGGDSKAHDYVKNIKIKQLPSEDRRLLSS